MKTEKSYNPFITGSPYFKPAEKKERTKAEEVIREIYNIKDELVTLDNTGADSDRKRGSIELLSRKLDGNNRFVLGYIEFDDYSEEKNLYNMSLSISRNKDCQDGNFVIDSSTDTYSYADIRNEEGQVETEIFNKHERSTNQVQSVYRDVANGEIMYKEGER